MSICDFGKKLALVAWTLWTGAAAAETQARCDIPGSPKESKAMTSTEACRKACEGEAWCKSYVHVSGWGRCFLKEKSGKVVKLRFYSGQIDGEGAKRTVAQAAYDVDYSGKDMRKLPSTATGEACGKACLEEPGCKAFAYLEGYRDCYLKEAQGKRREKIFSCGQR